MDASHSLQRMRSSLPIGDSLRSSATRQFRNCGSLRQVLVDSSDVWTHITLSQLLSLDQAHTPDLRWTRHGTQGMYVRDHVWHGQWQHHSGDVAPLSLRQDKITARSSSIMQAPALAMCNCTKWSWAQSGAHSLRSLYSSYVWRRVRRDSVLAITHLPWQTN